MQAVNIAELKNNLSAYLEQVKNGAEIIVKDRHRPIAGLLTVRGGFGKRRGNVSRGEFNAPAFEKEE